MPLEKQSCCITEKVVVFDLFFEGEVTAANGLAGRGFLFVVESPSVTPNQKNLYLPAHLLLLLTNPPFPV